MNYIPKTRIVLRESRQRELNAVPGDREPFSGILQQLINEEIVVQCYQRNIAVDYRTGKGAEEFLDLGASRFVVNIPQGPHDDLDELFIRGRAVLFSRNERRCGV